jgi:large subunit ribosomal protein L3
MKFILGTKVNMTEYFSEDGTANPVTVVSIPPVTVTRVFQKDKDGYDAVQVGYGTRRESKVNKAEKGTMKGAFFKSLKEFRLKNGEATTLKEGDVIDVGAFAPGDKIRVSGVSKGKGFQGVVKRHGFHGGPRTHGQKHSEREPGSIGGGLRTHVPKGMRMAGRMGGDRITQKNLKVVFVDIENNTMLVKGAITGKRGSLVEIIG